MAQEVYVYQKPVVDWDDKNATALITNGTTGNKLTFRDTGATNFRTRTGRKARLAFVGNAVDAGAESSITFHIYANGTLLRSPYDNFQQALGETYNGSGRISVPVDLPQNALIEVTADNSSTTDYNAFVRMRIEYEDYN